MASSETGLLTLAEAVADGSHVDWDHAESSAASADERYVIGQLRRLATVGQAARAQSASWGPLEIRAEVGGGTFGTVYRAWDTRLEREVALKLLHGEHSGRQLASTVIREARLLAQIRHPNVVIVHGADAFGGQVGIWMEFITGHTLKALLETQGPFGPHEAALIGRDICRALAAVHQKGFLHRDVKAQNVMREAGGRTVLMDFGAGEAMTADGDGATRLAGSPVYLAPEVLAGEPPSVRSDLYSLGVLLYHLVSGNFPVTGRSLDELRAHHAAGERVLLRDVRSDLPATFVQVVDRCTAPSPADRPESTGATEALLEAALGMREPEGTASGAAELHVPHVSHVPASPWKRWLVPAVGLAVLTTTLAAAAARWPWGAQPVVRRNSVAVLPLKNLSPDAESDYFSEGITQDLVAHLSTLGDLRVISGASVVRYRDRGKSATEIGSDLGVATVLDGSVRRSGDHVRIVSQLIDAATGAQLWSESFDRQAGDIFALQSEVSRKIALALKGELTLRDSERLRPAKGHDFEAFNLYLKGRYAWAARTEDGLNRSRQYFEEAIKRDPAYAPAYAGLADAYSALGVYGLLPRSDAFAKAAVAAEKAVALDDSLSEARASLGYVYTHEFEWRAAETSFRRAVQLNPGYATAHHWYSIFLTLHGRFPEAITEIKTAISLDPLSIGANAQLGSVLVMARRYDEAIAHFKQMLAMDAGFAFANRGLSQAYTYKGLYSEAYAATDRARESVPAASEDEELKADRGYLLAVSGHRAEALAVARDLDERYRRASEGVAVSIAAIYTGLGQPSQAFEWLARGRDARDAEVRYLKVDPRWDPLRGERRFDALLASLGFTH